MKRNFKILKVAAISIVSLLLILQQASAQLITNVPPDISAEEIEALVVEDFEQSPEWEVKTEPKEVDGDEEKNPVPVLEMKVVDGSPSDLREEPWQADNKGTQKTKVLGVNFQFKYPGYNSVHIIPSEPIQLPGRAKGVSLWVHGRGNNYYLETWIKDYNGNVHVLKFGSVNFVGWKPLSVEIPAFIPQSVDSYPQTKILTIERFVLRADPSEDVRNTFFFFDQVKVLTQTYEVNFDGIGLEESFESSRNTEGSTPTTTTTPQNNNPGGGN
jgi:hypothetical protein